MEEELSGIQFVRGPPHLLVRAMMPWPPAPWPSQGAQSWARPSRGASGFSWAQEVISFRPKKRPSQTAAGGCGNPPGLHPNSREPLFFFFFSAAATFWRQGSRRRGLLFAQLTFGAPKGDDDSLKRIRNMDLLDPFFLLAPSHPLSLFAFYAF